MRGTRTLATAIVLALAGTPVAMGQTAPTTGDDTPATARPPWLIDYAVSVGVEHSDNITLTHADKISQNLLTPDLTFSLDRQGSTLQAHATGQVEYVDYLEGQYVNEFRGQFAGSLNWVLAPERLSFAATDVSGIQPVQTRVEYAPNNLQQVNIFSAGPTLNFRLGSALRGQAELQYTNTVASKTKYFDSDRGSFTLRAIRDLDPTSQLSFNLEANQVSPKQTDIAINPFAAPSYSNYRAYGTYQSILAKLTLTATLGWTDYNFNQGIRARNGAFASVGANWQLTPRSVLGAGASHDFGDMAGDMAASPLAIGTIPNITRSTNSGLAIGSSVVTSQVFEQNQANLSYTYTGERFGFQVSPYYRRQQYLNDTNLDIKYIGANSEITYRLTELMTAGFTAEYDRVGYLLGGGHDTYESFGPYLRQQLTPHWSWRASLSHYSRHGSIASHDFVENAIYFAVSYRR